MTLDAIMEEILKDRDYYEETGGGVTLSGGEPLMQAEAAVELAEACRSAGLSVYLDTSGFADTYVFERVAARVDGLLYDIKIVDPVLHKEYTRVDNALILRNFETAVATEKPVHMRVIVIPGLTDTPENIEGIVALSKKTGFNGPIDLMPYHRMGAGKHHNMGLVYGMEGVEPPSEESLLAIQSTLEIQGISVTIQ